MEIGALAKYVMEMEKSAEEKKSVKEIVKASMCKGKSMKKKALTQKVLKKMRK